MWVILRPNGTLASEVLDGTGTQSFFSEEGVLRFEATSENFHQTKVRHFYDDGKLQVEYDLKVGYEAQYFPNGQVKREGPITDRYERFGNWKEYDLTGKLLKQEDLGCPSPKSIQDDE